MVLPKCSAENLPDETRVDPREEDLFSDKLSHGREETDACERKTCKLAECGNSRLLSNSSVRMPHTAARSKFSNTRMMLAVKGQISRKGRNGAEMV